MITTISRLPKEVENHFICKLLHERIPIMNEKTMKIEWYCKECDGKK